MQKLCENIYKIGSIVYPCSDYPIACWLAKPTNGSVRRPPQWYTRVTYDKYGDKWGWTAVTNPEYEGSGLICFFNREIRDKNDVLKIVRVGRNGKSIFAVVLSKIVVESHKERMVKNEG